MKILILNTLYSPFKVGGAEVSVQTLAEELSAQGHSVNIACTVPRRHEKANTSEVINGVTVFYIPLLNFYWPFDSKKHSILMRLFWHLLDTYNPFMIYKIKCVFKKVNPDIVHTNNLAGFSAGVLAFLTKTRAKVVHTARDYYFLHPNCTLMKGQKQLTNDHISIQLWSKLRGRYLKKVDHFVGISQYVVDQYTASYPWLRDMSSVVFNPVKPLTGSKPLSSNVQGAENKVTFGFIGRLSSEKGFEDFVRLSHEFKIAKIKAEFIVAGSGENDFLYYLKCKYPCADITFLGFVDPIDFYSKVDCVVLPIRWPEPFGRTIVEAAISGAYVIGYPYGGAGEVIARVGGTVVSDGEFNILKQECISFCRVKKSVAMIDRDFFNVKKHSELMVGVYKDNKNAS